MNKPGDNFDHIESQNDAKSDTVRDSRTTGLSRNPRVSIRPRVPKRASSWMQIKYMVPLAIIVMAALGTVLTLTFCLALHRGPFCATKTVVQEDPVSRARLNSDIMSEWTQWSPCDAKCGEMGNMTRIRVDPALPADAKVQVRACKSVEDCDLTYLSWSQWTQWSACTKTCAPGGVHRRTRECQTQNKETVVKSHCSGGENEQTEECFAHIDCFGKFVWSEWSTWSECAVICAGSSPKKERTRECQQREINLPEPTWCPGSRKEKVDCKLPGNIDWGEWMVWGECAATPSTTGTTNKKERTRLCQQDGKTLTDTSKCPAGESKESVDCKLPEWSEWTVWGECAATPSTKGTTNKKERTRLCQQDGKTLTDTSKCPAGESKESVDCKLPEWTEWEPWGGCTVSCGHGGSQTRIRQCILGSERFAILCPGQARSNGDCLPEPEPCSADWTAWSEWSPCTASGLRKRSRECQQNGAPVADPNDCPGDSTQALAC